MQAYLRDSEAEIGAVPLNGPESSDSHMDGSPLMCRCGEGYKLPKRIILMRHAQSQGNVDEAIYTNTPDWQVPLSDEGRQQALRAGGKVREILEEAHGDEFRLVLYCSPYERCRQTMHGVLEAFPEDKVLSVREEVQLREQDFGNFQTLEEVKRDKEERLRYGRFFYRFPHGESGADVYNRMTMLEDELGKDLVAGRYDSDVSIVIVSHGLSLRIMLMNWFNWTVDECNSVYNPPNATPVVLERLECPSELRGVGESDSVNLSWVQVKAMYRLCQDSVKVLRGVTDEMTVTSMTPKHLSTLDDS
mmetsp:Transcript_20829/g.49658  ORF Transcript_20829/g.49658 Transcript_20829/m.49658 type:complete len:304 (+) Transcript_20829:583-1494(+)